jgi:hypothetical protein
MSLHQSLNDVGADPIPRLLEFIKQNWPFDIPVKFGRWPQKSWNKTVFINVIELGTQVDDTLDLGANVYRYKSTLQVHILYSKTLTTDVRAWYEDMLIKHEITHTAISNVSSSPFPKHATMNHLVNKIIY